MLNSSMMHLPMLENQSNSFHYILPDTYFSNVETQKGVRHRSSKHIAGREAPGAQGWRPVRLSPRALQEPGVGGRCQMPPRCGPRALRDHQVCSRWHLACPEPLTGLFFPQILWSQNWPPPPPTPVSSSHCSQPLP